MSFVPGIPVVPLDPDLVLFLVLPAAAVLRGAGELDAAPAREPEADQPARGRPRRVHHRGGRGRGVAAACRSCRWPARWCSAPSSRRPTRSPRRRSGAGSGLQRRIMTILEGESLLNDATALTLFRVLLAVAIATGHGRHRRDDRWTGSASSPWPRSAAWPSAPGAGWLLHRVRLRLRRRRRSRARSACSSRSRSTCSPRSCTPPGCSPWSSPGSTSGTRPPRPATPRACRTRRCGRRSTRCSRRWSSR